MATMIVERRENVEEARYSEILRNAWRAQWLSFEDYRRVVIADEERRAAAQFAS
jgi:hypothetical protein